MNALLIALLACAPGEKVTLEAPALTLELPELAELAHQDMRRGDRVASWSGTLGDSAVAIDVRLIDAQRMGFDEPDDVSAVIEGHHEARLVEGDGSADFSVREVVQGDFGWVPFACLARADLRRGTAVEARLWILSGLAADAGWSVEVEVTPPPDAAGEKALLAFLRKGVGAAGKTPAREWRWSDEQAQARWEEFAPEDARKKFRDPIRTEHYIVLTNSSGGGKFGKKMEECYDTIQKLFPFPEAKGRKLMPVFLFRTPDQYVEYFSRRAGISLEQARRSKGHAYMDYYATWYEAPGDPVHIHEATHQIFGNRLMLSGGGSWFQEGVAEYVESRDNERNNAARLVKKRRHTPLREFVVIPSLLMSAEEDIKGGNEAGDHYKQAAVLVEFLAESKFAKARFQEFVHAVGRLPRGDAQAIEAAVQRIYSVDLEGLEDEWVEYCEKR